jgi:hypothetical protein
MPAKSPRELDEKRAYYRLLRYLLMDEVQEAYKNDANLHLSPQLDDLMRQLQERLPNDMH